MKKYLNIIAIVSIAMFTYSCEETVNGVELPYQELLVIRGELQADKELNIQITKTLPPLEEYDIDKATIDSLNAHIECDGVQYLLYKSENGNYYNPDLIPRAGKTYTFHAQWKNHKVNAITTVPINNDSIYNFKSTRNTHTDDWGWKVTDYTFSCIGEIDGNSATSIIGINDSPYGRSIQFMYLNRFINYYKGELNLGTLTVHNDENYNFKTFKIKKYDIQYYDYYVTMNEGEMESDVFVVSGNNITWNVKGDGIGLFIGSNAKEIIIK